MSVGVTMASSKIRAYSIILLVLSVTSVACIATAAQDQAASPAAAGAKTAAGEPEATPQDVNTFVSSTILNSQCPSVQATAAAVTIARDEGKEDAILSQRRDELSKGDPLQELLVAWLAQAKMWRRLYYTLTVSTLLFGGLATALHDEDDWYRKWKTAAALLATICGGLNSTLLPVTQYQKFDNAFAVLNTAKLNYLTNVDFTFCQVGKAVGYGEAIIHKN